MPRTRATVSRKSKSNAKGSGRKSAVKRTGQARKPAAVTKRSASPKSGPKTARHGIRTPAKSRTASHVAATKPVRHTRDAAPRTARSPQATKSHDTTRMKRTNDKPKATIKEKPVKAAEPVKTKEKLKAQAAPPEVSAPREPKVKAPKAVKATTAKVELPPPELTEELSPPRRRGREAGEGGARTKGTRSRAAKIPGFDDELMQDYVMDEEAEDEEAPDEMALDPLELPLELLDPELVEVPRPAAPKHKQKVSTANRRQQACANCGNKFTWLSVEQLCFNCLKRKLAQRKREDESYSGFTPEAEEEEDVS